MRKKVVIIGAGGHAKVIADIIEKSGDEIVGFLDDNKEIGTTIINEYKVIGDLNNRFTMAVTKENLEFIIAIGDNKKREEISHSPNLKFYTAIHPSAQIGLDVEIQEGTVIMANACINSSAKIGKHCIINTGAIIEHDNIIEDFVHISPNVALGGTVKIGESTHVGIGSIVKNNITICKNCTIGAGAVVVKNIIEEGTYVGVPARERKN
jgi:sugar O-acyltransferase (sialic acid O-acetyltransferase NeuD family)